MKQKTKRTIKRIAIILAIAVCGGIFGAMAMNAMPSLEKETNPDNLIKAENYLIKDGEDNGRGVKLTVKDDGTIKMTGKATSDDTFIIDELTLEPGTYTISGVDSKLDGVGLKAVFGANEHYAGLNSDTFVLESATTVQIVLYAAEDSVSVSRTVRPVLVEGTAAGEFYE